MTTTTMTVGELAEQSGLTVRTLHHYDQIGLLTPSHRSDSGYRLYGAKDAARLAQILALKQLGLPLAQIQAQLRQTGPGLKATLQSHLDAMEQRLAEQRLTLARLRRMVQGLPEDGASLEQITPLLEIYAMFEKYFTPEQLAAADQRREQLGEAALAETQARWPQLIAEMQALKAAGKTSADAEVLALAREWMGLVRQFTGGDPAMARSVATMYGNEPSMRERFGLDLDLMRFVGAAIEILRQREAAG